MKVSVITAFYKGNAYMADYKRMIRANQCHLEKGDELEVLIINDSPEEHVVLPEDGGDCNIFIYDQKQNGGIHAARVRGLSLCTGDYVIFLDQDDRLREDAVATFIATMKKYQTKADKVLVSNAVMEQKDGEVFWYRTAYHKKLVGDYKTYLRVGNQIVSPGQCLIPKASIPSFWTTHICKKNGSDDYFLWILLLAQKTPFSFVDEPLYVHHYTAQNLSADAKKMDASSYEFITYLETERAIGEKDIALLRRTIRYKDAFRSGGIAKKLVLTLQNLDIFIPNFIFKMRSKTPYGFNRE